MKDIYVAGAFISGVIGALIIYVCTFAQWGFLVALTIGWLPAMIGGFLIGLLWPVIVAILLFMLVVSII